MRKVLCRRILLGKEGHNPGTTKKNSRKSRTKEQPKAKVFGLVILWTSRGSFMQTSRVKNFGQALETSEKEAFGRGHPWPKTCGRPWFKGVQINFVQKTSGWFFVPRKGVMNQARTTPVAQGKDQIKYSPVPSLPTPLARATMIADRSFLFLSVLKCGVPKSGKKKEHRPKLLGPDIFWWGGGLPRERVGAKKFGMSLETQETKFSGGMSRDFGRDNPGGGRNVWESYYKTLVLAFDLRWRSKARRCKTLF